MTSVDQKFLYTLYAIDEFLPNEVKARIYDYVDDDRIIAMQPLTYIDDGIWHIENNIYVYEDNYERSNYFEDDEQGTILSNFTNVKYKAEVINDPHYNYLDHIETLLNNNEKLQLLRRTVKLNHGQQVFRLGEDSFVYSIMHSYFRAIYVCVDLDEDHGITSNGIIYFRNGYMRGNKPNESLMNSPYDFEKYICGVRIPLKLREAYPYLR